MGTLGRDLGTQKREERQVDAFDQIRLDGVGEVEVRLGEADKVVVEAPEDLLDDIQTRVEQGVLELGLGDRHTPRFLRGACIRFEITARTLRGLAIDGSGSIEAPQLRSDSFGVSIDGAGRITIQEVAVERLHVSIDGAGRVSLGTAKARETRCQIDGAGTIDVGSLEGDEARIGIDGHGRVTAAGAVSSLAIVIDGTGEADTRGLRANAVEVRIDGVGKVRTRAEETLDVRVDGFGRVEYSGDPRVHQRIDGSGRVVRVTEAPQS